MSTDICAWKPAIGIPAVVHTAVQNLDIFGFNIVIAAGYEIFR